MILNVRKPSAKARTQRSLLRQMENIEKEFRKEVYAVFAEQCDEAYDSIINGYTSMSSFDTLLDQWLADLTRAYWRAYRRVGTVFSAMVFAAVEREQGKGIHAPETRGMGDEFWNSFSSFVSFYTASKVVKVNSTTKRWIKRLVDNGIRDGKSAAEIAKDIKNSGQFNKMRASRIARTEVHMASNFATHQAVRSTRLRMEKEWVAFVDDRTRTSHKDANGQRVPMNEDFEVGGVRMGYPGDPRGGPANVINCRCVLLYHTIKS